MLNALTESNCYVSLDCFDMFWLCPKHLLDASGGIQRKPLIPKTPHKHHPFISEILILLTNGNCQPLSGHVQRICSNSLRVGRCRLPKKNSIQDLYLRTKCDSSCPWCLCQPDIKILQETPPFVKSTTLGAKLPGTAFKVLNHLHFSVIYVHTGMNTVTRLIPNHLKHAYGCARKWKQTLPKPEHEGDI